MTLESLVQIHLSDTVNAVCVQEPCCSLVSLETVFPVLP